MAFVNAEVTKLAVNTYVTTKISYANMLARICERLPGANVDVITSALGLDTRIGPKYLKGAVSYGGPCFPRDNLALAQLAQQLGVPPDLAQTVDRFNRSQILWLADLVQHRTEKTAGILEQMWWNRPLVFFWRKSSPRAVCRSSHSILHTARIHRRCLMKTCASPRTPPSVSSPRTSWFSPRPGRSSTRSPASNG
jgi:hypothetical protein